MSRFARLLALPALPVRSPAAPTRRRVGTSVEPTGHGPGRTVPDGYVRLVDDTGFITIAAPSEWADVDTAPAVVDGNPQAWIAAAPISIDRFLGTFEESGVLFSALPFDPDPAFLLDQFSITQGCTEFHVEPYEARAASSG